MASFEPAKLMTPVAADNDPATATLTPAQQARVREVLTDVKRLAAEYYKITSKPLGVTGEVGEMEAADLLGLALVPARTSGFDARRGNERIQIKTRAPDPRFKSMGRLSRISADKECDIVMLVILDIESMNAIEIYEAPFAVVVAELKRKGPKGDKARERGQLAVAKFISKADLVWKLEDHGNARKLQEGAGVERAKEKV